MSDQPSAPASHDARVGWRCALTTLQATRPTLGVSRLPDFDYDATGATTLGNVSAMDEDGTLHLVFHTATFEGPPVASHTTKVMGVPLPPGIHIDIVPLSLQGILDPSTGECHLDFDARFEGSMAFPPMKFPPMTVCSPLTTSAATGAFRRAQGLAFGELMEPDEAELVAVARVPQVKGEWDWFMNALLMLPTDALAVLPCKLRVWDPAATAPPPMDIQALNCRFDAAEL